MTKKLKEQLKIDEGFSGQIYKCSNNFNSIGYGRNLDKNPLTREEADYLLDSDLKKISKGIQKFAFYSNLNDVRKDVIINMVYNLGLDGFSTFKRMISALFIEDYDKAAIEMLDSLWAKQVGGRADRLARIMQVGV